MDEGNIRIILECVREASGQQKIQPDVWQYIIYLNLLFSILIVIIVFSP